MLDRRSARYRSLVVLVSLVGLAVPIAAVAFWNWRPLLGWFAVPVLTGLFLVLDARAVVLWRASLLDGWVAGLLDLDALRDGLSSIKLLPAGTISGMVDSLPTRARLQCFPDPKPLTREALAETVWAIDSVLVLRTAIATLAATSTLLLIAIAAVAASWWPLIGLPISLSFSIAARRIGSRPQRRWIRKIAALRDRGMDSDSFAEMARRLTWESLSPGTDEKWLRVACNKSA